MADFRQAADFVLGNEDPKLEGKVIPDPTSHDPKAIARFGVNSATHPQAVKDGFYEMGRDAALQYAEDVFKFDYFCRLCGYQIICQDIANKIADLSFPAGVTEAILITQRAVNSVLSNMVPGLTLDGKMGPNTVKAINDCEPERLLPAIKEKAKDFFVMVAAAHPDKQKDLKGWFARVDK